MRRVIAALMQVTEEEVYKSHHGRKNGLYRQGRRVSGLCHRVVAKKMIATFATMSKITVKIINQSANPLPTYATTGSAGMT